MERPVHNFSVTEYGKRPPVAQTCLAANRLKYCTPADELVDHDDLKKLLIYLVPYHMKLGEQKLSG